MHMRVIDRDERQTERSRKLDARRETRARTRTIKRRRREPDAVLECVEQGRGRRAIFHQHDMLAFGKFQQIVEEKRAIAFLRAHIAAREKPAEAPIGGAIFRVAEDIRRRVAKDEPRADSEAERADALLVRAQVRESAHDARERIAVCDPDPAMTERDRRRRHLFGMRGAAQKGEVRCRRQFGVVERRHGRNGRCVLLLFRNFPARQATRAGKKETPPKRAAGPREPATAVTPAAFIRGAATRSKRYANFRLLSRRTNHRRSCRASRQAIRRRQPPERSRKGPEGACQSRRR